ncbi:EpsG family protein [Paenibacillus sp. FSL L8-0708]|uniref:EpsG family protein n=1 Tax=Paenibacillus sp. FSL L8-0708 TaxID=2975311 RepID=UPI0030F6F7FB
MNYFLIIFIPTALYLLSEILPRKSNIFKRIAIGFLIIMTSLRYGFGADFFTYNAAFDRIRDGISLDAFEPGYIFLNKFISYLGLPFNYLLLVVAIFNYVLLYKAIEENLTKHKWLAMFLFLAYFDLFFYSLSAIRQSIALSVFMFASRYVKRKQLIKYVLWIYFASLFHVTALILIPFYFFYNKFSKSSFSKLSFVMGGCILSYVFLIKYIDLLRPLMNTRIEYYVFIETSNGMHSSILYAVITGLLLLCWLFIITKLKNRPNIGATVGEKTEQKIGIPMMAMAVFLTLKVMQYMNYFSIMPRLEMYFYCFYIFAIPTALQAFEINSRRVLAGILVCCMIFFFILSYNQITEYAYEFYSTYKLIIFN